MTALHRIVDFHSHHMPSRWTPTTTRGLTADQRARWDKINRQLADETLLLEAVEAGDLAARVVNFPAALIADAEGNVPPETLIALNDSLAALVQRHPGRLHGLASVDAFAGDLAAREVTRAIKELGLRGIFVESAKGDLLLDAPQARPALKAAAALGVPVFVHPINPQPLTRQLAAYGRLGTLFARGTINAITLIALIESGTFEDVHDLNVVVTTLAIGAILLGGAFGADTEHGRDARALLRRHVHVDTMAFDPILIRSTVDLLGANHVLAGSDWPIVSEGPIRPRLERALSAADLSAEEQHLVAGENALRLLRVSEPSRARTDRHAFGDARA